MGACPPLGMRLQKFLATYIMLLPEEEKGMFQLHHYLFFKYRNQIRTMGPFSVSHVKICHYFSTLLLRKKE